LEGYVPGIPAGQARIVGECIGDNALVEKVKRVYWQQDLSEQRVIGATGLLDTIIAFAPRATNATNAVPDPIGRAVSHLSQAR
jgi:hypothetical protein